MSVLRRQLTMLEEAGLVALALDERRRHRHRAPDPRLKIFLASCRIGIKFCTGTT
jgi:hypothetical protein